MKNDRQESALEEWKKEGEQERKRLFVLLDRLTSGEENAAQEKELISSIRESLALIKKERSALVGYIAQEAIETDELETRLHEYLHVRSNKRRFLKPAPTNAQIDLAENKERHFAQGVSPYKLFWVFFIGCFAGVMVERAWCLIRYGFYEPRVGLIYGPFNLVYGLGAWALTAALYHFRNKSKLWSFLGGALVGSALEYGCSWFQEAVFGSVSWDYSMRPFNLNGRICLQYSVYWGILSVMWIKSLYPRIAAWILKIPNRLGKGLTCVLAVFMVFNTVMTGMTVLRWTQRRGGQPPRNAVEEMIDARYPDERMSAIFTNLTFSDEKPAQEKEIQN